MAQEVIKVVTNQYVPVDNLLVYNAVTSNISSYKLE